MRKEKVKFLDKSYNVINRGSGAECIFLQISSTEGIKSYFRKELAEIARERQLKAYKHKIGPKVLSIVHPMKFHNYTRYGYKTQVVKVVETERFKGKQELIKKAKQVFNYFVPDETVRIYNVGRIRQRLVIIDFGNCSFE